jgi:hypothetical protein
MWANEGNCISYFLRNIIKCEPCCFFLIPCLPLVNTYASYRIGSNTTGFENALSIDEANLFPYLD